MTLRNRAWLLSVLVASLASTTFPASQSERPDTQVVAAAVPPKLAQYKQEAVASIDGMYGLAQQMVDSVFSFGEIGFQEHETQRYLTAILERLSLRRSAHGISGRRDP